MATIGVLALVAATAARGRSADYPNRPIKMVVGFAAGGCTDVVARTMAMKMSEIFHQTIVVENRTSASGMIAAQDVAKADPDGYTLMMGSQTTLAVGLICIAKSP